MAADRLVTWGDCRFAECTKVHRLNCGSLLGWAGSHQLLYAVRGWIEGGADFAAPPRTYEDAQFDALVISPDGRSRALDARLCGWEEFEAPFVAIGSGMAYALGAMQRGATAVQAVEAAMRWDSATGGGIDSLELCT